MKSYRSAIVANKRRTYRLLPSGVESDWRSGGIASAGGDGGAGRDDFNGPLHHRLVHRADVGGPSWFVRRLNDERGAPLTVKDGRVDSPRLHREIVVESRIGVDQCNPDSLAWRHLDDRVGRYCVGDMERHVAGDDNHFAWLEGSRAERQEEREQSAEGQHA